MVDPGGNQVPEDAVVEHLRFARITQVSIEGNAEMCSGLLATRYGIHDPEEVKPHESSATTPIR